MSRELDAQVAERVMGWLRLPDGEPGWIDAHAPAFNSIRPAPPAYSTDLNACAQAEARVIEMGLGARYAKALEDALSLDLLDGGLGWQITDYESTTALLTASAEARCRAMLQVVGEGA